MPVEGTSETWVCNRCKHLDLKKSTIQRPVCKAFPKRIPWIMLTGQSDHQERIPGDHGIRFEPIGLAVPA